MHRPKHLNQVGDTIVEVLLSVIVVGIAIGLGYGVASRSLRSNRQSQERVEALKQVESQIERLKKLAATDDGGTSGVFRSTSYCIADNDDGTNQIVAVNTPPTDAQQDPIDGAYPNDCIDGLYHLSINPENSGPNTKQFRVTARWFGLGTDQKQETTIVYRVYPG